MARQDQDFSNGATPRSIFSRYSFDLMIDVNHNIIVQSNPTKSVNWQGFGEIMALSTEN